LYSITIQTKGKMMKKSMLYVCVFSMILQSLQVSAVAWDDVVSSVKQHWPVVIVPTVAFVAYKYQTSEKLHAYIKQMHETSINAAFDQMSDLQKKCVKISLGVHTEQELLNNLHIMGHDKYNATKLLQQFEQIQDVVNGYNSWVRPWNWTTAMQEAAGTLSEFLKQYEIYQDYFMFHESCLRCWEMEVHYKSLIEVGVTDEKQVFAMVPKLCAAGGRFYLVDTVDHLISEVVFIKQFLSSNQSKKLYATIYQQMHELLSVLQISADIISKSSEYSVQVEKQNKHPENKVKEKFQYNKDYSA